MILDHELLFSNKQSVSATADSTNVIDFGKGSGRNLNTHMRVFAQLTNKPVGITSLNVAIKGSADGSAYSTIVSRDTAAAGLVAGAQLIPDVPYLVGENCRFLKVVYTVTGTATTPAEITAGIIADGVPVIETSH